MQYNHNDANLSSPRYTLKQFLPLIIIFLLIIILTFAKGYFFGPFTWHAAMYDFMGFFFLVFGAFKAFNLQKFAESYSMYDLLAQRSRWYALIYPFIELTLGVLYLMHWAGKAVNFFTLVLMLISAAGVAIELLKGKKITCACLGAVFNIPMTYVTLLEDLLMAAMAAYMLVM